MEGEGRDVYREAAEAIAGAQVLLLHLGAGMSADSNLKTFVDVANVPCYEQRGLTYQALSSASWLAMGQQDLFFGFWGSSMNAYRAAQPHEGYALLRKWRDAVDQRSPDLSAAMSRIYALRAPPPEELGPSFVYTSNIDSFALRSGLATPSSLYEYHGDTETWQCSTPCSTKLWAAPPGYSFDVDPTTMLVIPKAADFVPRCGSDPQPPHCQRDPAYAQRSFSGPLPTCPDCGAWARPSVLMFNSDDTLHWVRKQAAEDHWNLWLESLLGALRVRPARVVIVEVGAGVNVPSLRFQSERLLCTLTDHHRACPPPVLVRINPEHPGVAESKLVPLVIPVQSTALAALRRIDEALERIRLDALL